ncbi:hypothetical protein DICVIV_07960 [Dictyocaulus viviparus]|uniref:SGNH hydrolase-type esterase domain-containing protein n=1 Tax=Dictyocaulus viviparus TaxID=29172 RepID=A0A0D8XQH4_DICVI|nr:hypothetical protein DICVIV_07960 [Dictyocaulus viviparus]
MVFGTASFFYFFQMLNNLPRMVMYIWDNTLSLRTQHATIDVYPESSSLRLHDSRLINSPSDFERYYGVVVFSACNLSLPDNVTFHWNLYFKGISVHSEESHDCHTKLQCAKDGDYTVYLSITSDQGVVISVGSRTYEARTLWIAIIGDSFASGEGSPDVPKHNGRKALWMDDRCHRSSKSFAAIVFEKVAATVPAYLTFLACTGATIDNGILKSHENASQLSTMASIATKRGRGPDVVILTTGGNDIGFSDIINALVHDYTNYDISLMDMRCLSHPYWCGIANIIVM